MSSYNKHKCTIMCNVYFAVNQNNIGTLESIC